MKKYAVLVAGGSGSRMGGPIPKQFLLLQGKAVLWHTVKVFLEAFADLEVLVVLPEEHMAHGRNLLGLGGRAGVGLSGADRRLRLVPGGVTRYHSVQNGLREVEKSFTGAAVIFIHDGVRCLVSATLIRRCYQEALQHGSAIPVIDSRDSVRLTGAQNAASESIDRKRVKLVQTPQTFLSDLILPAYRSGYQESFTDEAMVLEADGHPVHLVDGEVDNIKITTRADLAAAEQLLAERGVTF